MKIQILFQGYFVLMFTILHVYQYKEVQKIIWDIRDSTAMNTIWCVNTVTLDVSFVSRCFILIECKGERWLVGGGRHNLATAPLRKISSLPPSPPFFLSHSLLSWPDHGWSIFFFFFSEEDKTGYKGELVFKKKRENKRWRKITHKKHQQPGFLSPLESRLPIVTGVSTVSSLKFWAPLNARMCFWTLAHPVPLQGVREQRWRQLFPQVRPGEAGFENCL